MGTENNKLSGKTSKFASILSQLRKERGSSQKKAAADLGISQALLSHYERGIRECGLDFVIKCSEYYGVTTDYLLGVSKNRYGMDEEYLLNLSDDGENSAMATLLQGARILTDTAASCCSNSFIAKYLHDYYMLCLYRGALTLAKAGILTSDMFRLDYTLGHELASAAIAVLDSRFAFVEDKSRTGVDGLDKNALNTLIEEAEEYIMENFISID
ncbi:MAG: helix-turn-helix transcriptional regulator [Clostridiales bacterium]|nr:helix-turn-helix transcriptional regulator [Clostridiales bacterium]